MFKTVARKIIKKIFKLKNIRRNAMCDFKNGNFEAYSSRILFLVTSVIYPWSSQYDEQRYLDTLDTIFGIRSQCPQADILLIDGGVRFKELRKIASEVNKFIYVGDDRRIRKSILKKNKGIGEAALIRLAYPYMKKYEFVFKISGRYKLSEAFDIAKFDKNALNYKNYRKNEFEQKYGLSRYVEGSHSTRLYGVPKTYYGKWMRALFWAVPFMRIGISMEYILPMLMDECLFYYHKKIGVTGKIAGVGEAIDE